MARLTPPVLLATPADLESAWRSIARQSAIALDTESNSLHAYRERVCLVQISTPDADYLIDPLAPIDLEPLRPMLAAAAVEKVLHACEYDVTGLRRDHGFTFAGLFDTMWAARILGWPRVGLADILSERFGVALDKRWQRHDWGRRPLLPEALAYARLDTHYLLPLREMQRRELVERGRWDEAQEVFTELARAAARDDRASETLWRIKGAFDLEPRGRAVLRELAAYREATARRLDRPPFKVMGDRTLIEIAAQRPTRLEQLRGVTGMTQAQINRHGAGVLSAVAHGKQAAPPKPPPRQAADLAVIARYERLRQWRKQAAAARGVDPDVIISNAALMALARRNPRRESELGGVDGLGPWRRQTYGRALLETLK